VKLPVDYDALTWQERRSVREQYVKEQNALCYHCGAPLAGEPSDEVKGMSINARLFPDNFFKHPVHLHHSHETGMTIGAVHNHCYAVLWQYHGE
jgi:hypothetical protein